MHEIGPSLRWGDERNAKKLLPQPRHPLGLILGNQRVN
jgi:hypothetical protein